MYKILNNLATYGIGEPGILQSYVDCEIGFIDGFRIIDVRTLIDGDNRLSEYSLNIIRVTSYLQLGENVVICSRAGVSISNAIALGVLINYFKMDFCNAIGLVISKVCICNILNTHTISLQKLFKL